MKVRLEVIIGDKTIVNELAISRAQMVHLIDKPLGARQLVNRVVTLCMPAIEKAAEELE